MAIIITREQILDAQALIETWGEDQALAMVARRVGRAAASDDLADIERWQIAAEALLILSSEHPPTGQRLS